MEAPAELVSENAPALAAPAFASAPAAPAFAGGSPTSSADSDATEPGRPETGGDGESVKPAAPPPHPDAAPAPGPAADADAPIPGQVSESEAQHSEREPEAAAGAPRAHAPHTRPARRGARTTFGAADDEPAPTGERYCGTGRGRVLAYLRRSSEDGRGRPLEAQREAIWSYVEDCMAREALPGEVDGVRRFFDDNGFSGTCGIAERPGLRALLEELASLPRAHVVVFDATRLARSVGVGNAIKEQITLLGATLHLAHQRAKIGNPMMAMLFGLQLEMAAQERQSGIARTKSAFRAHLGWDPRKSFGWHFEGAGKEPTKIDEEQKILAEMRVLYEGDALSVSEIARALQTKHGSRRQRSYRESSPTEDSRLVEWSGADVAFLAGKHHWLWGKDSPRAAELLRRKDLEAQTQEAVARGESLDDFLRARRSAVVDGVRINRAMLKRYFIDALPAWKRSALEKCVTWVSEQSYSIDDICIMLNEMAPRPGGKQWPRQTVWRMCKDAERIARAEAAQRLEARRAPRGGEAAVQCV